MQIFKDLVAQYWSSILSILFTLTGYLLIFLYKKSTSKLNGLLKETFQKSTESLNETNDLFEKRVEYGLKQAQAEYLEAIKLCEKYQSRVEHLEKTLKDFLDGGDIDECETQVSDK